MKTDDYVIRGGVQGRERLRLLAAVMGPGTRSLLAEVGIPTGAICLDVGCGGGDVTCELARAVGASGRVLGVDLDPIKVDIAAREAAEQGIPNVAFECRDVTDWEPREPFDVVYARFLLTHLADPAAFVSGICRHTRPGGVIVVEDIDFRGYVAEPDCPAFSRYVDLYTTAVRRRGADANIGPRLPGLLRQAGLDDLQLRLVQPAALQGGAKLLACVTLESISDAVIKDGLATEAELRATVEALYAFAHDPQTVIAGPRVFQAWGRTRPS